MEYEIEAGPIIKIVYNIYHISYSTSQKKLI